MLCTFRDAFWTILTFLYTILLSFYLFYPLLFLLAQKKHDVLHITSCFYIFYLFIFTKTSFDIAPVLIGMGDKGVRLFQGHFREEQEKAV